MMDAYDTRHIFDCPMNNHCTSNDVTTKFVPAINKSSLVIQSCGASVNVNMSRRVYEDSASINLALINFCASVRGGSSPRAASRIPKAAKPGAANNPKNPVTASAKPTLP